MNNKFGLRTAILMGLLTACNGDSTPAEAPENADAAATKTTPAADNAATEKANDIGDVLATVGDISIGTNEWQIVAARMTPSNGETLSLEEKEEVLNNLIEQKLLYLHAKNKGVDRDPKVQKLMVQTLMRNEVYSTVRNSDFSAEELKAYFETNREDFVVPEKVQIRRIHIKAGEKRSAEEAKGIAEDLRKQLVDAPEKFKALAKDNSEDPYRKRGGDLGFVAKEGKPGIPSDVVAKAFAMDVGALSEVFESGGGFNVITVVNRRERVERTYEQMKGSVLRKMKSEKFKSLYDAYVDDIRGAYSVDTKNELLNGLEVKAPRKFSMGDAPQGLPQVAVPPSIKRKE